MTPRILLCSATALTLLAPAALAQPEGPITTTGVTAHRGFSGAHVENTMPAFEEALALDVDWIELDVFTTADGRLVVTHDGSTLKLTGEEGRVGEMTSDEIAALDTALDFRSPTGVSEARVPPQGMPLLRHALERVVAQERVRVSLQPEDDSTPLALVRGMGAEPQGQRMTPSPGRSDP